MVGIPTPPSATSSYYTGSGTAGALVQSATGVQVWPRLAIETGGLPVFPRSPEIRKVGAQCEGD